MVEQGDGGGATQDIPLDLSMRDSCHGDFFYFCQTVFTINGLYAYTSSLPLSSVVAQSLQKVTLFPFAHRYVIILGYSNTQD